MSSREVEREKKDRKKKKKKDKKERKKDKKHHKKDKKTRKDKKRSHSRAEEDEEDEWVVRTPPLSSSSLMMAPSASSSSSSSSSSATQHLAGGDDDDLVLRTPPRPSNDGDDEGEEQKGGGGRGAAARPESMREVSGMGWMMRPPTRDGAPVQRPPSSAAPVVRPPSPTTKPRPRELNPYMVEGGSGLPPEDESRRKKIDYAVGDGGRSWRDRAQQRLMEQAADEGTTAFTPAPTVPARTYEGRDRSSKGLEGWRRRDDDRRREGHDERKEEIMEEEDDGGHVFRSRKREAPTSESARDEPPQPLPPSDNTQITDTAPIRAPQQVPSEEEANKIQAQLLKAEMMGDEDRIKELKGKLAKIREAQKVVVVSGLDRHGRPINLPASQNLDEARRMLAAERETDTLSSNLDFARSLARHQGYIGEDFGEVHMGEEGGRSKKRRRTAGQERSEEDIRRHRAISGENLDQRMRENCAYCLDEGKRVSKHLMITVGQKAYVCLPHQGALVPDHCLIVPLFHAGAATAVEADVYEEIVDLQRALVRMYAQEGKAPIFFETAATGKRAKHMVIHCIPMPKRDAAVAPGYFKKTLSEAGSEWGQHRKIIDTTGRGVRRAIPKEFPYFHVQFPDGTSFAHVIEEVKEFPQHLGKEVIAGILELPPEAVRGVHESHEAQRARAQAFQRNWRPFDPIRAQRSSGGQGPARDDGARGAQTAH